MQWRLRSWQQDRSRRTGWGLFRTSVILVGTLLLLDLLTALLAEGFWYDSVGYSDVFATRLFTQAAIGLVVFAISFGLLNRQINRAVRQAWPALKNPAIPGETLPSQMRLLRLLLLGGLGSLTIAASLFYYARIVVSHWQPNLSLRVANLPVPLKLNAQVWQDLLQGWQAQPWQLGGIAALALLLLIYPQIGLRLTTVVASLCFMLILSEHWDKLLLALHQMPYGDTEPLLQRDVGFYIFSLPIAELLEFWLIGLAVQAFLSVGLIYLLSADSLSQGYFPGFSGPQLRHLCRLGGWLLLALGFGFWIDRYMLLFSPEGASYGASYTSATFELPFYTLLSLVSLLLAGWLFFQSRCLKRTQLLAPEPEPRTETKILRRFWDEPLPAPVPTTRRALQPAPTRSVPTQSTAARFQPNLPQTRQPRLSLALLWSLALYSLAALVLTALLPMLVQRFVVQPNELQLEQPYLQRTIALTRRGFNLDTIDAETFVPDNSLTLASLQANRSTVDNIRLWDKRPLLETNRQLQRIRLYYEFPDADIDRYTLPTETDSTTQQQVLIAARELDYGAVPTAARTWINEHLVYTHGYGFTVSPVNKAGEGGLPDYLISGIEPTFVDPRVQGSIPIGKPRIYFGELTDTYVMTQTRVQELDFPSGSDNVYNSYQGWDGISLGNFGQRLLYAKHLKDWRMLLTDDFTPQTRLLFRRSINERVRAITPFLRYDSDPYLVVVNTGDKQWQHDSENNRIPANAQPDESYLYWVIDAYTTSNRYPYSDPLGNDFNYIRNSVKVVIDAYHGAVTYYVSDPEDPIIRAWSQTFPAMFQPLTAMPDALRRHLRYPQDYFQVQSNQLMTYHMTDPIVFYNREDQWRAPNEIYASEQQVVEPYYLIMNLPTNPDREEFILLRPFTPAQRNNLIAWLAARSDGDQYGRMLLYVFPKQELIFGPEQIEARINQDPVISERISLWNRQGSRAAQGNLLVIPIERSLLYVEPLYLVAEQNQLPTLVRVIAVYGSRIAMAETLEQALTAVFTAPTTPEAPILRPTGEEPPL